MQSQVFMRAAPNIGFTLGAMIGGLALAFDHHDVIRAVPLLTGLILIANSLFLTRLPDAEHAQLPLEKDQLINRAPRATRASWR
ncbi:MAG: rane protein [Nocardioides sp.]|nr:rane protein [Nocardioides sp.]